MWPFTASVGAPRVAALEFPFGLTVGRPDDADGQRAVVRAALRALEAAETPGSVTHLSFDWGTARPQRGHPRETPPIVSLLRKRPWLYPKMLLRKPPPA